MIPDHCILACPSLDALARGLPSNCAVAYTLFFTAMVMTHTPSPVAIFHSFKFTYLLKCKWRFTYFSESQTVSGLIRGKWCELLTWLRSHRNAGTARSASLPLAKPLAQSAILGAPWLGFEKAAEDSNYAQTVEKGRDAFQVYFIFCCNIFGWRLPFLFYFAKTLRRKSTCKYCRI